MPWSGNLLRHPYLDELQRAMLPRSWRKFERIISYLRRYVKGFAKIVKLLNDLFGRHPYPYLDDFSEPCCPEVDARFKGFRATLSQKVVGRKIVLAYASRGLRKHELTCHMLQAARPLEIVAMDFTQLEKSTSGIENVLVFTDVFTKYTITIPTRDQTEKTVSRLFVREWIKKLGVP